MRLLSWVLCAAAAIIPVLSSEEKSVARPKRESSEKKIVCYYTNWSVYRPGTAKFSPQNINPYLCTHLIYAFGGLSKDNALKPFDKYQDIEQGGYAKFNGLKTYNKNLKTMLAIGGWNEGSARFSPLVADAERRKELVKNTVKFLRQNHFDGLDLDWEYPSFRDGGKPRDRDNYATLVQEFREEFERESEKTGRPRLLLTMAVPAGIEYIDKGYDVPRLNKYLDWMNILSYDYHSAFEPAINHHSPLFSLEEDDEYNFDAQLSIDYTVKHYIKLGADRNKLVLGIPTYGRSYTLFNPDATDIGSPADGPGEQGEATREKGYLAYYEICERVSSGGWTEENPYPDAMGPYAYKDNQWVGYDDEGIARAKAKYVNDNDLGGIMFWSIDNDDFRGKCHGKPYPIIEAAKEALLANANELVPTSSKSSKKQEQSSSKSKTRTSRVRTKTTTTTEASKGKSSGRTTTTPQPPTTPDPGSDFVCKDEGFFPHPRDCKKYFWCLDSGPSSLGIVAHQFTCPSGLVFNKISDSCDYARNVICKNKKEEAVTTTTTTTTTSTTTARTTTARSRLVITASPPRTTLITTTEAPDEEDVEEDEEEDEEDPGTIKELISLIKKLGGVEQLEKQLNLQNSDTKEKIKPSLYTKVLQGRTGNRYRGVTNKESTTTQKYTSAFRNRPVGPQSSSADESGSRNQERPKYVTIQRNRTTKKPAPVEEDSETDEEEIEEQFQAKTRKEESIRPTRRRPQTSDATTEREYVTLRRSRPPKTEEELTTTSKYKNVVRVRSTTEAVPEEEEDVSDEEGDDNEEDEVAEEEAQEESKEEVPQKFKKYSSIIRDKKITEPAAVEEEEEETKVSGPHGSRKEGESSSSTTEHTLHERDDVNNVHKVTSSRYVEIRRTTQSPTTQNSVNDVNIVNNSSENDEENKVTAEPEGAKTDGFQSRSTSVTESNRRVSRLPFRSSAIVTESVLTSLATSDTTSKENEIQRFRGRFRSSTESSSTPETKSPYSRYKTINRNSSERPTLVDSGESVSRFPKRERSTSTTSTTSTTTTITTDSPQVDLGVQKRFQFAPRTKPTILTPKTVQSTTETFTITVPDLPDPPLTENAIDSTVFSSPFPSVTLEPTTSFPSIPETADFEEPANEVGSTKFARTRPSTRFIPTTSTQTSVVTSITESLFTERGRILVPKRGRGHSPFKRVTSTTTSTTTPEPSVEITRPVYRPTGYKSLIRSTTPKPEVPKTKETGRRRFKSTYSTTTTTEAPEKSGPRYVPKKVRNFKEISSTETPSSTTVAQRIRYTPRNRFRQVEQRNPIEPVNSLNQRFGNTRKRKINSQRDENDLAVEQTENYFGGTHDNSDRYILGGEVRQTSDKNYQNAVFVYTQSATEKGRFNPKTRTSGEKQSEEENDGKNSVEETTLSWFQSTRNLQTKPVLRGSNEVTGITPVSYQPQRNPATRVNSVYPINPFTSSLASSRNRAKSESSSLNAEEESKESRLQEGITKGSFASNAEIGTTSSVNNRAVTEPSFDSFQSERITKPQAISSGVSQFRNFRAKNPEANAIGDEQSVAVTKFPTNETITLDRGSKTKPYPDKNSDETKSDGSDNLSHLQVTTEGLKRSTILSNFKTSRQRGQQSTSTTESTKNESFVPENGGSGTAKFRFLKRVRKIKAKDEAAVATTSSSTFGTKETSRGDGFFPSKENLRERNQVKNDVDLTRETSAGTSSKDTEEEEKTNHFIRSRFRGLKGRIKQASGTSLPDINSSPEQEDNSDVKTSVKGTQLNGGTVSVIQYKSRTTKESNQVPLSGTTVGFQEPKTKPFNELVPGGLSSTLKGSTVEYLDPSIGTTYGLKTGVSLGVTRSLSSPFVSTEKPNTLAGPSRTATERTLRPIVVASVDSTPDSSIDTAIRVVNLPLKSQSSNAKDLSKTIDNLITTTNRLEPEEVHGNDVLPTTQAQEEQTTSAKQADSTTSNSISTKPSRSNFRPFKTRFSAKETDTGSELTTFGDDKALKKSENDENKYPRGGKRVLVKARPIRPGGLETEDKANGRTETRRKPEEAEDKEKDVRSEAPPTTSSRFTSIRRGNQDNFVRNRIRSTTSTTTTTAQTPTTERRRTLLDRRRLRPDSRSTTPRPDVQTETYSSTVRSSSLLRRRRPTTSTTTTTTTTETPYLEVQEDSSLEESKTLDESPDIQDLADPAVVAIHTLATVAPGSLTSSGRPLTYFSPSIGPPVGTPDTYTVHVTPGDIESITPGRIATIAPGTVRPTSILTLKPFTIPVITKTAAKQGSISSRKPSPFRANGIPLVTEEPYDSRDDILQQARRLETIPKSRPLTPVTVSPPPRKALVGKSARPKPFSKVPKQEVVQSVSSPDPSADYEYYDEEDPLANIPASALKVKVHSNGYIECLDQGNFPHPFSCKKFISCAKMENNELLGWEYTCPKHLSFDPVGGICNWAAGLGCQH